MKNTLLLFYFSILSFGLSAQSISGEISTNEKPASGAVVVLISAGDSVLVRSSLTEADGRFAFANVKPGAYKVVVTFLGFKRYISPVQNITDQSVALGKITLEESSTNLGEVQVTAKRPFIEKKIDCTVINPEALISNAGVTAVEVLEKAPGIQIDMIGGIAMAGKPGVMVLIDDKPTYLAGQDLINYLRGLPSGSIDKIELMTNPPAKYDAAGNAGIINIKLKRTVTKGFNGGVSLGYGQGRFLRTNNSANINYRRNKTNFFANVSANQNNSYQDLTIWRTYRTAGGALASGFTQNSYIPKEQGAMNLKLGADFYPNAKSTMGFVITGFENVNRTDLVNNAKISDETRTTTALNEALNPSKRTLRSGSFNLNYAYKPNKTSRELSSNIDFIRYNSRVTQSLASTVLRPDRTFVNRSVLDSELPAQIDIATAKIDYTTPLADKATFEAGAKTSFIRTDNIADFFDVENGIATPNYSFSNRFKYAENINAAYVNYNREWKKLSVQSGLRYESTLITGKQLGNPAVRDSSFVRNYGNFFPTFYMNYRVDSLSRHVIGLSLGRRISRPDYQSLNPFTYPMDRFTLYGGNPFLRPTFQYEVELSHTYKGMISNEIAYSVARDVIFETIEQGSNIFYSRPGNIGKQRTYSWLFSGSFQPKKWWTLQLVSQVIHNRMISELYGQQLRNIGTFWVLMPTNIFQINKKWSAEFAGQYQSRAYAGQFVIIPVWNARVAVSKRIFKNQGTFKFGVSDLFYTNQPGGDIQGLANSSANWKSFLDTRVATVALGYRFNKGQNFKTRKTGGSESEQSRVKG